MSALDKQPATAITDRALSADPPVSAGISAPNRRWSAAGSVPTFTSKAAFFPVDNTRADKQHRPTQPQLCRLARGTDRCSQTQMSFRTCALQLRRRNAACCFLCCFRENYQSASFLAAVLLVRWKRFIYVTLRFANRFFFVFVLYTAVVAMVSADGVEEKQTFCEKKIDRPPRGSYFKRGAQVVTAPQCF